MNAVAANTLLLVDGHAYAYRAFHAIRELSSPDGAPTNAIFGFVGMVTKLLARLEPSHVAVVWDGGLDAERLKLIPDYKAQRPAMPDALEVQIAELQAFLPDLGVASLVASGVEADDWIAALAVRMTATGAAAVIASSDKDFMQLVGPRITLVNPNTKDETLWGEREVREKTGVLPAQVVDWLSLMGDAVDNIPGVSGVGPKTAADLLGTFGSVEALYQRLAEVTSDRLRSALSAAEAVVRRNQDMIRLRADRREPGSLDTLRRGAPELPRLAEHYRRWGFRRMLADLEARLAPQLELLNVG
jgi:DNA polymerase-1